MGRKKKSNFDFSVVEAKFKCLKSNQRVTSVNDIPLRIIRQINTCVRGRHSAGTSISSMQRHRRSAWDWLNKIWNTSEETASSDYDIGRMLLSKVTIEEWKKLGVHFIRKVSNRNDVTVPESRQGEF
jgi:hypothetical protein